MSDPLDFDFNDNLNQAMGRYKRPTAYLVVTKGDLTGTKRVRKPYKRISKGTAKYVLQNHWRGLTAEIKTLIRDRKELCSRIRAARVERAEAARRYLKVSGKVLPELRK